MWKENWHALGFGLAWIGELRSYLCGIDPQSKDGEREGKLVEALRAVVDERDSELDMMRCDYPLPSPENVAWHEGVKSAWKRFGIVKRNAQSAVAAYDPQAQPKEGEPTR